MSNKYSFTKLLRINSFLWNASMWNYAPLINAHSVRALKALKFVWKWAPGRFSQLTTLFGTLQLNVERVSMIENACITTDISLNLNKRRIKILAIMLTIFQRFLPAYVPMRVCNESNEVWVSLNSGERRSKWSER